MSCIKKWYLKSEEEATCPMCRQRLYFKGMHKQEERWEKERHAEEIDNVFENCFNFVIEQVETWKTWIHSVVLNEYLMDNLCSMEYFFNKYKKFDWDYWEDFEDAVNGEAGSLVVQDMPGMYYELLIKNMSLLKFSKNNSKRFFPNVYCSFV